ncbi:MAG: lactate utilization protein [Desulfovibrionaceae bacterium]|nr:lactate utilization protein [Desulfovibrionaceae bacterium]
MPDINQALVDEFRAKAQDVNAVVRDAANLDEALRYVVDVCEAKAPCEMLADEPDAEQGPLGPNGVPTRVKRIVAAPGLDDKSYDALSAACEAKGFACVRDGLRRHLAGIDVGFSVAELGVAASGTCMVNTDSEEGRLAGMIAEISVIALKKSDIHPHLPAVADKLRARMGDGAPTYTTFITGPSRTADIERVPAVGVHGPLELHILLLEA